MVSDSHSEMALPHLLLNLLTLILILKKIYILILTKSLGLLTNAIVQISLSKYCFLIKKKGVGLEFRSDFLMIKFIHNFSSTPGSGSVNLIRCPVA